MDEGAYRGDVLTVLKQVAIKQLLSTLSRDLQIWGGELKPKTVVRAGQLANNYVLARKQLQE